MTEGRTETRYQTSMACSVTRMQGKSSPWSGSCDPGTGSVFQPLSTEDRFGRGTGSIMSQTVTHKETCQGSEGTFLNLAVWLMAQ